MTTSQDIQDFNKEDTKRTRAYSRACLVLGSMRVEDEKSLFDEFHNYNRSLWKTFLARGLKEKGAKEEDVEDALQQGLKELWEDAIVWMAANSTPPQHLLDFINVFQGTRPLSSVQEIGSGINGRLLTRCQSRYFDAVRKAKGLKKLPTSSTSAEITPLPKYFQHMFPMTPEIEQQLALAEESLQDESIEHLQAKLSLALLTLKHEDRALLLARYGDAQCDVVPYEELAFKFGITVCAVGARIRRAQVKLKDYFERHGI